MNSNLKQWPRKRLRFVTSRNSSELQEAGVAESPEVTFLPMEAIGEHGELDLSVTRPIEEVQSGYSRFSDGDVVVAKITPCFENGKGALIRGTLTGIGFGTTELHVLTPGPELDGKFLYYVTVDPRFRGRGQTCMTGTAGQQRVPEDFVRDFRIFIPPLPCQHAITDYLDREMARLDSLLAANERLLGLVADKRQALITRAVTRGLDPNAPLRDSGVSWLGEIPAPWRTDRAHWLFHERDHRSETGEEELLTVSHLTGVTPRAAKDVYMFEAKTTEGYKLCMKGDLVINTLWAWMGAMGVSPVNGIVSPAYNVYVPTERLDPGYVDALVRLPIFAQEVTRYSKGVWSSRLRLYPESFFEVSLPIPPLSEQRHIVSFLAEKSRKLDALKAAAERTIGLLKERRAALIAAAVKGQIGATAAA
jgi:type I restriction enzyme, S subunit